MSVIGISPTNKKFYFNPDLVRTRKGQKAFSEETKEIKEENQKESKSEVQEEAFTRKEIVGAGSGYKGPLHVCPLTRTSFRGGCPIMPCHANITSYKPEKSCCLYLESEKTDFDKWDLQEHLDIKESRLYKNKEKGERKVTCVIMLYKVLSHLRETCKAVKPATKDIAEITNFINASYLGLHEINSHLSDVQLIKDNLDKVREFISKSGQTISLPELLGTEQPLP